MSLEHMRIYLDKIDQTEKLAREKLIAENSKLVTRYEKEIEATYQEVINIYKEHDKMLAKYPLNESALKRSYASKAGAVIVRRGKLKRRLEKIK